MAHPDPASSTSVLLVLARSATPHHALLVPCARLAEPAFAPQAHAHILTLDFTFLYSVTVPARWKPYPDPVPRTPPRPPTYRHRRRRKSQAPSRPIGRMGQSQRWRSSSFAALGCAGAGDWHRVRVARNGGRVLRGLRRARGVPRPQQQVVHLPRERLSDHASLRVLSAGPPDEKGPIRPHQETPQPRLLPGGLQGHAPSQPPRQRPLGRLLLPTRLLPPARRLIDRQAKVEGEDMGVGLGGERGVDEARACEEEGALGSSGASEGEKDGDGVGAGHAEEAGLGACMRRRWKKKKKKKKKKKRKRKRKEEAMV